MNEVVVSVFSPKDSHRVAVGDRQLLIRIIALERYLCRNDVKSASALLIAFFIFAVSLSCYCIREGPGQKIVTENAIFCRNKLYGLLCDGCSGHFGDIPVHHFFRAPRKT